MSAAETLSILEETADVMDETLDVVERLVEANSVASASGLYISKGYLVGAMFVAAGVGYSLYKLANFRAQAKYEAIAEQEIADAKIFYSRLHKKDEFSTPEKVNNPADLVVKKAVEALEDYQNGPEDEEPEEEQINVFMHSHDGPADEDWDEEAEMETRDPDKPYIISVEEFNANEDGLSQTSITYYYGDNTLADEQDLEIPFSDPIVGSENLYHFGKGSGDPRILYIRNERLSTDFEVVKSDGKYAHEVLGLQHSDGGPRARQQKKQQRKYRGDDE